MVRIGVLLATLLLAAPAAVAARSVSDILRDATRCFAAYDAACRNFFGPTGVLPEERAKGIG